MSRIERVCPKCGHVLKVGIYCLGRPGTGHGRVRAVAKPEVSTADIAGLDPNFTGSDSVDEYVRKLRDG